MNIKKTFLKIASEKLKPYGYEYFNDPKVQGVRYCYLRKNKRFPLIICLLILSFLIGCERMIFGTEAKKSILLDNLICQVPCWQNIYPGETTFAQAVEILANITFIQNPGSPPSPAYINEQYGYSAWSFTDDIRERGIGVYEIGKTVGLLEFDIRWNFRIDEMMTFYGEPESIFVISGMDDSRWLDVFWIYPSKGVILELFDFWWKPEGNMARITPDMKVYEVFYFDPEAYESLLERRILLSSYDSKVIKNNILPWKGYGLVPYVDIHSDK